MDHGVRRASIRRLPGTAGATLSGPVSAGPRLRKIVSGGQTGVDQAALRAARVHGLAIGGWCPPGRVCEAGLIPSELPLRETPRERSELAPDVPRSLRTEWNSRDSDATLILRPSAFKARDPGTEWTAAAARHYGRPILTWDPEEAPGSGPVAGWLVKLGVETLHVAGPSESARPGLGQAVERFLSGLFERLRKRGPR